MTDMSIDIEDISTGPILEQRLCRIAQSAPRQFKLDELPESCAVSNCCRWCRLAHRAVGNGNRARNKKLKNYSGVADLPQKASSNSRYFSERIKVRRLEPQIREFLPL